MNLGLERRSAVVCGASSGIGLAIAEALAEEGAHVAMFARRRDLLEREADRLGALAVRGDLTNPLDLERRTRRLALDRAHGGFAMIRIPGPSVLSSSDTSWEAS